MSPWEAQVVFPSTIPHISDQTVHLYMHRACPGHQPLPDSCQSLAGPARACSYAFSLHEVSVSELVSRKLFQNAIQMQSTHTHTHTHTHTETQLTTGKVALNDESRGCVCVCVYVCVCARACVYVRVRVYLCARVYVSLFISVCRVRV